MPADDEEARKKRADELRRAIDEASERPPATPREFTDEQARKAAREGQAEQEDEEE